MKKFLVLTIVICLLLGTFAFSGCSKIAKLQGKTYVSYVNAKDYTAGDLETDQDFEDILIDWFGGSVNIYEYDGDTLVIKEETNKNITDAWKLRWAFWDAKDYGKYFSIQYSAKGTWKFEDLKKDLTILIPKKYTTLNHLSVTARDECDINIYLPSISFAGDAQGGAPNVHLDAEWGNINAVFKDIEQFRMIGDGDDIPNQYYRRLHAQNVGSIDYVSSYSKAIFEIENITSYADIKQYAGDVFVMCYDNIRKLKASNTIGTTYIMTKTFERLDFIAKDGIIGVQRLDNHQKFTVTMSNYTEYSSNIAYKEPHFEGRIGMVPDDELQPGDPDDLSNVTNTGNVWKIGNGKNARGKDVVVNVESGADVYFGDGQSLNTRFAELGVIKDLPSDPEGYVDPNQNSGDEDPNGDPNQSPNGNPNQNNNNQ